MMSWSTFQSLLIFVGPLLLPRILATYRSLRAPSTSQRRLLTQRTSYALAVLFTSGLIAFLSTLPLFSAQNVFKLTQSRFQTPTAVIFTRLAAVRSLTHADDKLRQVLDAGGLDARLLYAKFGPTVLADCPIAAPGDVDSARTYLFYALPYILAPHLLHLFALGIATSGIISGKAGARWRTVAAIAGMVLAITEAWFIASHDDKSNAQSNKLNEVDFVYWKIQVWRGLAIAGVDGLLGWVIYLQATGRAFMEPLAAAKRVADNTIVIEGILGKTRGLGVVRNTVVRDADMRRAVDAYWIKEGEVMRDVMEEPEVLEAQRNALRRLDLARIGKEADQCVEKILGGLQVGRDGVQID